MRKYLTSIGSWATLILGLNSRCRYHGNVERHAGVFQWEQSKNVHSGLENKNQSATTARTKLNHPNCVNSSQRVMRSVIGLVLLAFLSACGGEGGGDDNVGCKAAADSNNSSIPPPDFGIDSTRTDLNRITRPNSTKYSGQLIDASVHLDPPKNGIDISALNGIIQVIKDTSVAFSIFMPTPGEGRKSNHEEGATQRETLLNLDSNRVRLFCGSNYITVWLHQAYCNGYSDSELQNILTRLASDLDGGKCVGAGEIAIYHFNKTGSQNVIQYPPNFEPFLAIVDVIAGKNVWLELHAEPVDPDGVSYEAQVFGGLALLYSRQPNLKLILSHTAMTNPNNVRNILTTYQNVMMNFKIKKNHQEWRNLEPIVNTGGEIYEDWAQLFEEMPGRFMIGTDSKFGRSRFETSDYLKKIDEQRDILGSLNSDAARKIAYENAFSLFN